jgi:hypothetical protein
MDVTPRETATVVAVFELSEAQKMSFFFVDVFWGFSVFVVS